MEKCQKFLKIVRNVSKNERFRDGLIYMIRVEKTNCDTRYESQSLLQNYQQSAQITKHCALSLAQPRRNLVDFECTHNITINEFIHCNILTMTQNMNHTTSQLMKQC